MFVRIVPTEVRPRSVETRLPLKPPNPTQQYINPLTESLLFIEKQFTNLVLRNLVYFPFKQWRK